MPNTEIGMALTKLRQYRNDHLFAKLGRSGNT